ncbi:ABC-three component system protein [Vampirovibrio sp.]|uniref:ABC-three component system protein n=1 Tax=Vampirovibrio sp. TaxID=2717857 RepID=UPI0035948B5C
MILLIDSDLPTFKAIQFHKGLNVLLSDKSPDSGAKQTRNSAGKTSLIEIIHFVLGGDAGKSSLPRNPALINHFFIGTFQLEESKITIKRSGKDPAKIWMSESTAERLGLAIHKDKNTGATYIKNAAWKELLGHKMFALPAHLKGSAFDVLFSPSFRGLFPYFSRQRGSAAFFRPEKHNEKQQRVGWQVNLSYLLGLDWRIPVDLQQVRERESQLKELKQAAKSGAIGQVIGTVAELRPKVVLAEDRARKLKTELSNFQVIESYRELSNKAAKARTEMLAIERQAISLKETLNHLQNALEQERGPESTDLTRLYKAIGVELPGVAHRRFEEVAAFHNSVVENRRNYLQEEITGINAKISHGERVSAELNRERSEILKFLSGRGALEDFTSLQKNLAELEAEAAALRQRFQTAEILEGETTKLDIERANIKRRLQEDHHARKTKLDTAIRSIGNSISDLYDDRSGEFVVEATDNGPEFKITIQGDRGGGISNMEIFCLDQTLFAITGQEKRGPGFLIHDSHLFDGVDERQVAQALLLGKQTSEETGGQYIVMMNSDIFDGLPLPPDLDRESIILSTRLSDEGETGGLFGIRFD